MFPSLRGPMVSVAHTSLFLMNTNIGCHLTVPLNCHNALHFIAFARSTSSTLALPPSCCYGPLLALPHKYDLLLVLGGAPSLGSPWGVACYLYLMQRYALIGKHKELGHIGTDANTMQLMTG